MYFLPKQEFGIKVNGASTRFVPMSRSSEVPKSRSLGTGRDLGARGGCAGFLLLRFLLKTSRCT